MKKLSLVLSLALLFPAFAFADTDLQLQTNVKVNAGVEAGARSAKADDEDRVSVSSRTSNDEELEATSSEDSADADTDDGKAVSEAHMSAVASFVKSLLADADRDGGIGAEVRAVARSQQESASTTAEAIVKVEKRGKFMAFLFGSDWKNIGTLRSQIAKSEADEKRLTTALDKTTNASVRADLQAQLDVLKAEQAKIQAFADAHENSFSLFGWFTKLFVSSSTES